MKPFNPDSLGRRGSKKKELLKDPDELKIVLGKLKEDLMGRAEKRKGQKLLTLQEKIDNALQSALQKYTEDLLIVEEMKKAGDSNTKMTEEVAWMNFSHKVRAVEEMIENLQS